MKKVLFLCSLIGLALAENVAWAQNADETGRAYLRKAAAACGGTEAFQKVKTLISRGKIVFFNEDGASIEAGIEQVEAGVERAKTTLLAQTLQASEVLDQDIAYQVVNGFERTNLPKHETKQLQSKQWHDLIWLFSAVENPKLIVRSMGETSLDNQTAHVLLIKPPNDAPEFQLYVRASDGLPIQVGYAVANVAGTQMFNGVWRYQDFQEVGTMRIPHRLVLSNGRRKVQEIRYESMLFNEPLAEDVFSSGQ